MMTGFVVVVVVGLGSETSLRRRSCCCCYIVVIRRRRWMVMLVVVVLVCELKWCVGKLRYTMDENGQTRSASASRMVRVWLHDDLLDQGHLGAAFTRYGMEREMGEKK